MKFAVLGRILLGSALCAAVALLAPTGVQAQRACSITNDIFLNPFNRQSAQHMPIGTGARYAGDNHPATRNWLKAGGFAINPGYELWGSHILRATSSDPVRTVQGRGNSVGLPAQIRLPAAAANTPRQRSGKNDNVVVIFNSGTSKGDEFYRWDWNGGNPAAWLRRTVDWRGLGHGTARGQRVGNTAAGLSMAFGILRGDQINKRGHRIEHALSMALPRKDPGRCNVMLSTEIQLPATAADWDSGVGGNNSGEIPYGALMALPPSVNLNSLGLSEPGMRLAEAIRGYGIRVVDGGGCGGGAMRADQHIDPQVRTQLRNDVRKLYRHIRLVTNGEWRSGMTAIGGGQPIAPNCAFDASASQQRVSTPSSPPAASTPQNRQSGSTSTNQNQQASSGSTNSAGGMLSWPATRNAQSYYFVIREGSSRGPKVFERMVRPQEAGCGGGQGTCSQAAPPLAAGKQYAWAARALVNGNLQAARWQQVASSSSSGSTSTAQSSTPNVPQNASTSSNTSGGSLNWAARSGASSYYLVIREGSGSGPKAFDRMVTPQEAGCAGGQGTCSQAAPPLPANKHHVWNLRAVVDRQAQPLKLPSWQPVN